MTCQNSNIVFQPHPKDARFINHTNERYGDWTVLGFAGKLNRTPRWWCQCICGVIRPVIFQLLKDGSSQSCGCTRSVRAAKAMTTHGETVNLTATTEYSSFKQAKGRCRNKNSKDYPRYGGRGIEFRFENFQQFLDDIGRKPTPQHSLDRINVNGHYEVGNVRWATIHKQQRNMRNNHWVTVNGVTKILADWAKDTGQRRSSIHRRIRSGWCEYCAIFCLQCDHLQTSTDRNTG